MDLDFLAALRAESDRFLAVLHGTQPSAPVPTCPDWNADDLLWHLGEVQWFWGEIVERRLDDPDDAEAAKPARPDSRTGLVSFFEDASTRLSRVLEETPPETQVWMWSEDKSAGYVRRRQAHEALIHRVDAELTAGVEVNPLPPALAADGVLEALTFMLGGSIPPWGTFTPAGATVSLEVTDTGLVAPVQVGRFTGTSPDTGTTYDEPALQLLAAAASQVGATADATVRATAADLDCWLWGRRDSSVLDVGGDPAAFRLLEEVVAEGVE